MATQAALDDPTGRTVLWHLARYRRNLHSDSMSGFPYSKASVPTEAEREMTRIEETMWR